MDLRPIAQTLATISKNKRYAPIIHTVSTEIPLARGKTNSIEVTFRKETTAEQRMAVGKRLRHLFSHPRLLAALIAKHSWKGKENPEGTLNDYSNRENFERLNITASHTPLIRKSRAEDEHAESIHIKFPK